MNTSKAKSKVENLLKDLLQKLDLEFDLDFDDKNDPLIAAISSPSANLLIGYRGETLNSIQHFVNVCLYKEFDGDFHVVIDVAGYRGQRKEKLEKLAENASIKAKQIEKQIALYPMNSFERKIVHEKVATIEGVSSESQGEGSDRRVVISPGTE